MIYNYLIILIFLFIIIFYLYSFKFKIKIASITMIKYPFDFHIWLHHYLNILKLDYIILIIDDNLELYQKLLNVKNDKLKLFFVSNQNNYNVYTNLQSKQIFYINHFLPKCRELKINFLLHIDDDELLIISKKYNYSIHSFIQKNLNLFIHYSNLKFQNFEAVYPLSENNCFYTPYYKPCQSSNCKSYVNGKSMGNLLFSNLKCIGPHDFSGSSFDISEKDAILLHFDNCHYIKWLSKFNNLSNSSQQVFNQIPFDFYKNSISLIKKCKQLCLKDSSKPCLDCLLEQYQFWFKSKYITDFNDYFNLENNNFQLNNYYEN